MIKVVLVGQNPANLMKEEDQPFKDTKSLDTLRGWVKKLELDEAYLMFFNASEKKGKVTMKDVSEVSMYGINNARQIGYKVISLGNYASKALARWNIEHYKLPHPSPRNFKLNNKKFVDKELETCYNWLRKNETK